jgi:PAS domain S-box-containing protein
MPRKRDVVEAADSCAGRCTGAEAGPPMAKGVPAEEALRAQADTAASPMPEDIAAVVHDLRVHQIELEMQNEELRRAQLELAEQREKYFELFDRAPVGYVTLTAEGLVAEANVTAARLLGVERPLLVGQQFTAFVLEADRDKYYLHRRRLVQSGTPQAWEVRLQRLSGSAGAEPGHFWARLEGRRQSANGKPGSFWVTFSDVTKHREANLLLRRMEAMRDTAERIAHIGSVRWDLATQKAECSPETYRLFAIAPEEFDSDSAIVFERRVHPDDRVRAEEAMERALQTGATSPAEYRVTWPDGSEHVLRGEGATDYDEHGEPVAISGYFRDVTEERRAAAALLHFNEALEEQVLQRTSQLEAANGELEAFVYSASHDLRAPLRAIDGFSQMIVEDASDRLDPDDMEHLQRVRAAARRMALLIDHLIGLSRTARQDLLRAPTDLSAMAESVLADLREAQPERQVTSVVEPGIAIDADASLLHVILTNLLANAWKFTSRKKSARIEVGVRDVDGQRAYFVTDDGAGLDLEQATHLFGAFQRYHSSAEFEGDGIGLATVQRLVARHGGRAWAESEVEKGATFFFTLPSELG